MIIYRMTGHFLFGTVNQDIFKTWESLVLCTIFTWSYTNKYYVLLYHNIMVATSLFRELNKKGTIAHNIANHLCGHLIFLNQVRYTAGKVTKIYFHTICNPPCRDWNKTCFMFPWCRQYAISLPKSTPATILSSWKPTVLLYMYTVYKVYPLYINCKPINNILSVAWFKRTRRITVCR